MAISLDLPAWPNGAQVAIALTFDVDLDTPALGAAADYSGRLSTLSAGRYGVRGLGRITDLLASRHVPGTFYVPGFTAERYPDAIREVLSAGHEVAHHGYLHLSPHQLTPADQRDEITRGLSALGEVLDVTPLGYRSPAWELTPHTFDLLREHGFRYDSSCMGDDRPYLEVVDGHHLLELPVDWSLDDWPHFSWKVDGTGQFSPPSTLLQCWLAEYRSAFAEKRLVTYTMHPEVIGRPYRLDALARLIDEIQARGGAWFARHRDVAALIPPGPPPTH